MSTISPELQMKISQWRLKCADGSITREELQEAVVLLRQGRVTSATSEAKSRKKAIIAIPKALDMLNELEGL